MSLQMPLYFKLLESGARLPTKAYSNDAAFDLYTSRDTKVSPMMFQDVPCGVAVDLPDTLFAQIVGRSSAIRSRNLMVLNGVIDPGYRGELFVACYNTSVYPVVVKAGERVGQLILFANVSIGYQPRECHILSASKRNQNGFGSSGL